MNPAAGAGWSWTLLWFLGGILGPSSCLVLELASRMCRESLFDPLPTIGHVLLVLLVPISVYAGLKALVQPGRRTRTLGVILGSAICTTLMLATPFVPLLPISLYLSLVGIGLLGLAPVVAPLAVITLALRLRRGGLPGLWTGFLGCVALLALLDLGAVRTIRGVRAVAEKPEDAARADWLKEHADREMLEELGGGRTSARPLAFLVRTLGAPVDPEFVRVNWTLFTGQPLPERLEARFRD